MGKLFGTDGIRGKANVELTPELAFKIGKASAYVIKKQSNKTPKILVAMDSRISGKMLESALVAGMCSVGADVTSIGIIPTPAVAYLIKAQNYDAGAMISASHNPFYDNGIKLFNSEGYKLSDAIEEEIESYIFNHKEIPYAVNEEIGTSNFDENAKEKYINFITNIIKGDNLKGLKIALDCANGATSFVASKIFEKLGAEVLVINNNPNGININDSCGSTHPEALSQYVKKVKADVGFAFDGDGDRLFAVDENGKIIDGDEILSIVANSLKQSGNLKKNTVVVTVMSNLGFFQMGEKENLNVEVTAVGDRYVLEKMIEKDFIIGGEQSGHIIFLEHNTTGDGILSAVILADILIKSNKKLSDLNSYMTVLPQVLINAIVKNENKYNFESNEEVRNEIERLTKCFDGRGRVLIRPSGTEPFVRVMIEGADIDELEREAKSLACLIEKNLG